MSNRILIQGQHLIWCLSRGLALALVCSCRAAWLAGPGLGKLHRVLGWRGHVAEVEQAITVWAQRQPLSISEEHLDGSMQQAVLQHTLTFSLA